MAMTLGIITSWSEEGFKYVADLGLKAAEFCYNVGLDSNELKALVPDLKKWSEKYDVKVMSIGRWGSFKFDEETGEMIEEEVQHNLNLIDVCGELGCPVFNTGINYVESKSFYENCNNAIAYLKRLADYGRDKNVKIAVYNCDWKNFVRDPETWKIVLGALPEVGIKYDPSHCINCGSADYLGEIAEWGKRIFHFHIKGTLNYCGKHLDDPPAGLDMVQWRPIMGLLYKHGYDGMLSIEPHSRTWCGKLGDWGVKLTIDYISKMVYTG
ncbi:MAG: sugar phosphate isomerase/epimerase [Clostridiales bacterium]|jgi:sugar phosphate isomerase/epimerase|nr:sugar phosphate isomerase/epimerase [Clostridiales bacterium]